MKTFYLTIVFEVGVTVEQEEDWLNDPTIPKTIPISELSKEEIKRIKRRINENVVWFGTNVAELGTEKVTQNNNLFTTKCKIATDDIDQAIKELKEYFEDEYGIWQLSDREFRTVPCSKRYDNWPITYNLDLVLKSVEYKEGEEIDVEKHLAERLAKINFATWELPTVGQPSLSFNPEPIGPLPDLQFNLPNLGMYGNVNQGLPNLGIIQSPSLAIMQSPPLQRRSTQEAPFQGLPAPFQGLPAPFQGLPAPFQGLPALLQSPPLQRRSVQELPLQGLGNPWLQPSGQIPRYQGPNLGA
jgi:hypothetical protein